MMAEIYHAPDAVISAPDPHSIIPKVTNMIAKKNSDDAPLVRVHLLDVNMVQILVRSFPGRLLHMMMRLNAPKTHS